MSAEERAGYLARGKDMQQYGNENSPQRWAGQLASGLSYAPFAGAAPVVVGGAEGTARSQALQDQGVLRMSRTGLAPLRAQFKLAFKCSARKDRFRSRRQAVSNFCAWRNCQAGAAGAAQSVASDAATNQLLVGKATTRRQSSLSHH